MSFDEIVAMIIKSFNKRYCTGTSEVKDKVLECATQIYIEQMKGDDISYESRKNRIAGIGKNQDIS